MKKKKQNLMYYLVSSSSSMSTTITHYNRTYWSLGRVVCMQPYPYLVDIERLFPLDPRLRNEQYEWYEIFF